MSRNNISKNDIVHNIKNRYRLPVSYVETIYDNIFLIIKNGLKKDGRFKISKFGTFKVLFKRECLWPVVIQTSVKTPSNLPNAFFLLL